MFKQNHVGRPSNDEVRKKRIKKILIYGSPILLILIVIVLITSGNFSNLMGNSIVLTSNKSNTYLLGDVNKDGEIDISDATIILRYSDKSINYKLDEVQMQIADINNDGKVNFTDAKLLQIYILGSKNKTVKDYKIGIKKICNSGYKLEGNSCKIDNTFKIKFNSNGGTGTMADQSINIGVPTPISANKFTKSNSAFTYWTIYNKTRNKWLCYDSNKQERYLKEKDCKNGYVHRSDKQKISQMGLAGEELHFYAQWTDEFIVKFNSNGGTGTMTNQTIKYGVGGNLKKNNYTKNNYVFVGWKVQRNDGKWLCYIKDSLKKIAWTNELVCKKYGYVLYNDGKKVLKITQPGSAITMYAHYLEKVEKVSDISLFETFKGETKSNPGIQVGTRDTSRVKVDGIEYESDIRSISVVQDIVVNKDNVYISNNLVRNYDTFVTITKINRKTGNQEKVKYYNKCDNKGNCESALPQSKFGHGTFEMANNKVILTQDGEGSYYKEYIVRNDLPGAVKIDAFSNRPEMWKVDSSHENISMAFSKRGNDRIIKIYDGKNQQGEELKFEELSKEQGVEALQGFDIYDGYIYIYYGDGLGYGGASKSHAYIDVYKIEGCKKNAKGEFKCNPTEVKFIKRTNVFESLNYFEPEGISVYDGYAYISVANTAGAKVSSCPKLWTANVVGCEKFVNIYKIPVRDLINT